VSSFDEARLVPAPTPSGATSDREGEDTCVFCEIVRSKETDEARHVLWTGKLTTAILNAYPYSPGHVMVLPVRHLRDLEELEPDEAAELWRGVHDAVAAVKAAYFPEGLNLGVNLGRAAGAGIPAHLHVHIVPRWIGDTNFMTSVAEVRVLPEALNDSWARLRAAWA
jgi:ATP adenylyltransferase